MPKLTMKGRVFNKELRECLLRRVERGETTFAEVAINTGYYRTHRRGKDDADSSALRRSLGILPRNEKGRTMCYVTIPEKRAIEIMHAMNADPIDVGL